MKNSKEQTKERNKWYFESQVDCAKNPAQKLVISDRKRFINCAITKYQKATNKKILDAGCGDGVMLMELEKIKNVTVYGIDYNPLRIQRAKENIPSAIVDISDLRKLKFSDNFFDFTLLNQVLEHIPEDTMVLKELYRVIKPGGILILGVPNEGCFLAQLRNKYIQPEISRTTDHIHFYTEKEIVKKLKSNSFVIENIWRQSFFIPHLLLGSILARFKIGYRILQFLGDLFISQCVSLYFVCKKVSKCAE